MIDDSLWPVETPFIWSVTVSEEDLDELNHTNNGRYVNWCESAAWAHSQLLGLSVADYHRLDRAMAVHHGEYDYLRATFAGDVLHVGTWLAENAPTRMMRRFQIIRESDMAVVFRGRWDLVCIELSTGKPRRQPPEFLEIYGAAVARPRDAGDAPAG